MAAKQKSCFQFLQNCQGWLSSLNPFKKRVNNFKPEITYKLLTEPKN